MRSSLAASSAGPARESTSARVFANTMTASAFADAVPDTPGRLTPAGFPTMRSFMPGSGSAWLQAPRYSFPLLTGDARLAAAEVFFALGDHLVAAGTELVRLLIADVPAEVAARNLVLAGAGRVRRLTTAGAGRGGKREQNRYRRDAPFNTASHPCARTSTCRRPASP